MKKTILILCAAVLLLSGCSANKELFENNSSESTSSSSTASSVIETSSSSTSRNTITSSDTSSTNTDESSSSIAESSDTESSSEEPSIVLTEDYVLSNSTETLTTPSGNIWFDLDGQYVTYIDRWESMNDDEIVAEAYLDMTDILVNTKHGVVNFVWANKEGNFEALGVIATKWNGKILNCSKIVWFGDKYKRLNSNEFADIMYEALQENIGN